MCNLASIGPVVLQKMFKNVNGRTTDGRTYDESFGHMISSPCEPKVSGELKISRSRSFLYNRAWINLLTLLNEGPY